MNNLENRPVVIGTPVEIDRACEAIRQRFIADLPWLDRPYFVAKRFFRKDSTTKKQFIFPETYAPHVEDTEDTAKYPYQRLTPAKNNKGMCFFYIDQGRIQNQQFNYNFLTYKVGIIFSVNLKLIDQVKLNQGIFTRELMSQVRRSITSSKGYFDFDFELTDETDDLQMVFKEFRLDEIEAYNRAPLQCFRINLNIIVEELCI